MRIQTTHENNLYTAFGLNQSLALFDHGLSARYGWTTRGGFRSDAFSNPFFGFTAEGYHGAIAYGQNASAIRRVLRLGGRRESLWPAAIPPRFTLALRERPLA